MTVLSEIFPFLRFARKVPAVCASGRRHSCLSARSGSHPAALRPAFLRQEVQRQKQVKPQFMLLIITKFQAF